LSGSKRVNPEYLEYKGETSLGKPENLDKIAFLEDSIHWGSSPLLESISCTLFSESNDNGIIMINLHEKIKRLVMKLN
jgi:hypothetical protein